LLPVLLWIYEFASLGIATPVVFLTQGLIISLAWVAGNILPWAAIIFYREELAIRREQKPKEDLIGTPRWLKSLEELIGLLPKHERESDEAAKTKTKKSK
jgi:hypothetical protein